MSNEVERKVRPQKTKTIVQQLTGKRVVDMLPDSDKVDIMSWLLQLTSEELAQLVTNKATPMFIIKCAEVLKKQTLADYMDIMNRCRIK